MNNKEFQAETEAQQSKNDDLLPSTPLVANLMLAAALTKNKKRELLEKGQVFERLSWSKLSSLIWWEWFNKKKLNKFYYMLKKGKAAMVAFEDANSSS